MSAETKRAARDMAVNDTREAAPKRGRRSAGWNRNWRAVDLSWRDWDSRPRHRADTDWYPHGPSPIATAATHV